MDAIANVTISSTKVQHHTKKYKLWTAGHLTSHLLQQVI